MFGSASFKQQKLNKSMVLESSTSRTDSPLFTPRMSVMNSIAKSVKYNDLQFITGEELCKLRRQPQQPLENPEYSIAKNNMTSIKKRYNQTNHHKIYLQNKIQRLNQQKAKYLAKVNQFQSNKSQGKQQVINLENQLQSLKLKLIQTTFLKMSMTQMHDVIVHDKIVFDKRKYDLEKYLHKIVLKSKSIYQSNIHQSEEEDRTLKVYQKLISKLGNQSRERQQHINSIEFRINQKSEIQNSSVLRKSQMLSIAQNTMCERNPQEKDWINVFLTHKLLQDILKSKIQREMKKFSLVQQAFKNIKIATGVNDAHTLVEKFLSKQQIYGDLLSKITENEREIQNLRKDKEQYLKEIKKTQEELQQLQTIKIYDPNLREWLKEADYYDERRKRSELQSMKLTQYLFKHIRKISAEKNQANNQNSQKLDPQRNKWTDFKTKQQIKENFIKHLKDLSVLIDESEKIEINNQSKNKEDVFLNMNEYAQSKTFRVKPHVKVTISAANDKNFSEEQIQSYEDQDITAAHDQLQVVDQQRLTVLKSNAKFMRQLRNRILEQKQLMVQTLVKNTKEKAPIPVKKIETPQQ